MRIFILILITMAFGGCSQDNEPKKLGRVTISHDPVEVTTSEKNDNSPRAIIERHNVDVYRDSPLDAMKKAMKRTEAAQ